MTRFRTRIAGIVPRGLGPMARRQIRIFDQIRGYPGSGRRPGVVLMLHVGRCGSTVLASLLAQNPAIFWDGKLPRKARDLYGERVRALDPGRWTRRQFAISGDRFYGFEFKILADQYPAIFGTTTPRFLETCKQIGVTHFILLTRRNTLRHVVSHYASMNRGKWHASTPDALRAQMFPLDISDITTGSAPGRSLVDYLQEVEDAHDEVRGLLKGERLLEIEYEEDIDAEGPQLAYRKVCVFLGIPPVEASIRNVKVNPYPMASVIENFDEITHMVGGTKFAWMTEGEMPSPAKLRGLDQWQSDA
jgi:hypothetical protein